MAKKSAKKKLAEGYQQIARGVLDAVVPDAKPRRNWDEAGQVGRDSRRRRRDGPSAAGLGSNLAYIWLRPNRTA
jgi:hypothetical protein